MIPFTVDQFLNVFEQYNVAVWPAQVFLYTIGIVAICLALSRQKDFSRSISLILLLFWIWMGIVYHLSFFSAINKAARGFAALLSCKVYFFSSQEFRSISSRFALAQIFMELLVAYLSSMHSSCIRPLDTGSAIDILPHQLSVSRARQRFLLSVYCYGPAAEFHFTF